MNKKLFILLPVLLTVFSLHADVVWPALVVYFGISKAWWYIITGLLVKYVIVARLVSDHWSFWTLSRALSRKIFLLTLGMNLLSAFVGLILSLLFDSLFHQMTNYAVASAPYWRAYILFFYVLSVAINVVIESFIVAKVFTKLNAKNVILWITLANVLSVGIALLGVYPIFAR